MAYSKCLLTFFLPVTLLTHLPDVKYKTCKYHSFQSMCLSTGITIGGAVETLKPTLRPPGLQAPTSAPSLHVQSDTWLRTMLVFYSLNARLNHLAGDWPEENWMLHLPDYVKERPLTQLSIPGSHNSFAYDLDVNGPLAPDLPREILQVANYLADMVPTSKIIMHNWSKTQQLNFEEQLKSGVRYFDCRIGYHSESGRIRFLHGLWGPVVETELKKLPPFLDSHPGEVVILDFNHIYAMEDQDHGQMMDLLNRILGDYLIPYQNYSDENGTTTSLANLTLANLNKESKQQVIVTYAFDNITEFSKVIWPGNSVESVWPDTTSVLRMVEKLDSAYMYKGLLTRHSPGPPRQFYVYQGILTPDGDSLINNMLGSLYDTMVPSSSSSFINWLVSKKHNKNGQLNICIVDAVEAFNFLPTVVAMNIH